MPGPCWHSGTATAGWPAPETLAACLHAQLAKTAHQENSVLKRLLSAFPATEGCYRGGYYADCDADCKLSQERDIFLHVLNTVLNMPQMPCASKQELTCSVEVLVLQPPAQAQHSVTTPSAQCSQHMPSIEWRL